MDSKQLAELVSRLRNYDSCTDSDVDKAADVIESMLPRWQAEPSGDGWYWVEGDNDPQEITTDYYTGLWIVRVGEDRCTRLDGRRVAPVTGRPQS